MQKKDGFLVHVSFALASILDSLSPSNRRKTFSSLKLSYAVHCSTGNTCQNVIISLIFQFIFPTYIIKSRIYED